jgi:hypothetical protein
MHVSFDISMIFENNQYRISRVFFLFLKINVFLFFYFYITCVFLFTINNPRIGAHKLKYCVVECTNRVKSEKSKISGPQTWWMVRVCQLIFVHKFQSCHFRHMLLVAFLCRVLPFLFTNLYHSRSIISHFLKLACVFYYSFIIYKYNVFTVDNNN